MNPNQLPVLLVDASIYVFRAWFSIPDSVTDHDGHPVNAAYGFARFLTELVEQASHAGIAVAFDESLTRSFRNEIYPPYKANRELPPEELKRQFAICRRFAEAAGICCYAHDLYEADDLIATLARNCRADGQVITVVTGDKDLAQVIQSGDCWWDFSRKIRHDADSVKEKFGVYPEQIADYLGLVGDQVDNIPGVPGVGAKTAAALLDKYGNLDTMYASLEDVVNLSIRGAKTLPQKLAEYRDEAYLSKRLATVESGVKLEQMEVRRSAPERRMMDEVVTLMGGRGGGLVERLIENFQLCQAA